MLDVLALQPPPWSALWVLVQWLLAGIIAVSGLVVFGAILWGLAKSLVEGDDGDA